MSQHHDDGEAPPDHDPKDVLGDSSAGGELEVAPTTPIRRNTDISNASDASSLFGGSDAGAVGFVPPPSPFMMLTPAASEDTDDTNSTGDKSESACPKWSDVLRSPSEGGIFSPAIEISKPGYLHGLGLRIAADRAKKLSKTGRRCAALLNDVAGLQSTFAQEILTACQTQYPTASSKLTGKMRSVQRSLISFANQIQGLVVSVRGSIARPLNSSMASMGDTVPSIFNRYVETRIKCTAARATAIRARAKYVKASQDAEAAIQELEKAKQGEDGDQEGNGDDAAHSDANVGAPSVSHQDESWEKKIQVFGRKHNVSPERLIVLLNDVQLLEAKYRELVDEENQAVSLAASMEVMVLEALQKLEEERLQFFVESLSRTLQAEKGALDKMVLSTTAESMVVGSTPDVKTGEEKKPKDFFMNLLKTPLGQDDDAVGTMEAETLGLPNDVGLLRDQSKASIAAKQERFQTVKSLAAFLEAVSVAASGLSTSLHARLGQDGYGESRENSKLLPSVLERSEGPRVLSYWDGIAMTIEGIAESSRHLAFTLRNTRRSHLDDFVLRAEREIKSSSDTNDLKWKQLCHAARQESKALVKYEQTMSQFAKARDRVQSVDDNAASGSQSRRGSANQMAPGMSKALGNMFSILPDGGDQAMQMLTPGARMAVARRGLEEADQRETKDKEALEAAEAGKTAAIKSFTATTQLLVSDFEADEEACWENVNSTLESVVSTLAEFRTDRYNAVVRSSSAAPTPSAMASDMTDWTDRARRHIRKRAAESDPAPLTYGFRLAVDVEETRNVYRLLSTVVGDVGDPFVSVKQATPRVSNETKAQRSSFEAHSPKAEANPHVPDQVAATGLSASTDVAKDEADEELAATPVSEKSVARHQGPSTLAERDIFLANFWSDHGNGAPPPAIIESFTCAYWPKEDEGYLSPLLHGRLFVTAKTMYFVGWGEKKIVLELQDVTNVEKATNLLGAIDNAMRLSYGGDEVDSSYFFGSFVSRDDAFILLQKLVTIERSLQNIREEKKGSKPLPEVVDDKVIRKMDIILTKHLKNVSIRRFYELIWSEGNRTDAEPFYGPWSEDMGSRQVHVADWEFSQDGSSGFRNVWCGETYSQRRVVTFEFTRTTHLYVGPPTANVTQTQHCTVDENDRCIVQTTVEMEGIPYSDCFAVEVRWVAHRVGANDIRIQVGAFVNFKKSTMFAKQIRSGTVSETKPVHQKLFDAAKKRCAVAISGEKIEEEQGDTSPEEGIETLEKDEAVGLVEQIREQALTFVPFDADDSTKLLILGVVIFAILRVCSYVIGRRGRRVPLAATTVGIEELNDRMNAMQTEMHDIHEALQAILKALQGQQQ